MLVKPPPLPGELLTINLVFKLLYGILSLNQCVNMIILYYILI